MKKNDNKSLTRRMALGAAAATLCGAAMAGPAEDAQAAFARFFPSFVAGNQDKVAALFAPDAQFYGTQSPQLVTAHEGVQRYFNAALNRPGRIVATPVQLSAKPLSDDVVLIAGVWKAEFTVDEKTVPAGPFRVTAVMQKRNNDWAVVQFHNSPLPATPAAPAVQPPSSR